VEAVSSPRSVFQETERGSNAAVSGPSEGTKKENAAAGKSGKAKSLQQKSRIKGSDDLRGLLHQCLKHARSMLEGCS
jgi:hypothetical protein